MNLHLAEFRRAVRAFRAERLPGMRAYYRADPGPLTGYRAALDEIDRLRAENDKLRADMSGGSFYQEKDIDAMQDEIDRLRAELKSVKDAFAKGETLAIALDLAAERERLTSEIDRLRDELEKATKPDSFWFADDPAYPLECWSEAVDDVYSSDVVEVMCGKSLPNRWVATICLTVDENGDPDEIDTRLFDNLDEAKRCWPESLAAARAALNEIDRLRNELDEVEACGLRLVRLRAAAICEAIQLRDFTAAHELARTFIDVFAPLNEKETP